MIDSNLTATIARGLEGATDPLPPAFGVPELHALGRELTDMEAALASARTDLDRRLADPSLGDLKETVRRDRVTAARREVSATIASTEDRLATAAGILDRQAENFQPLGIAARRSIASALKNPTEALAVSDLLDRAGAAELRAIARVVSAPGTGRLDLALAVERAASRLPSEEAAEIVAICRTCPIPPPEAAASRLHAELRDRVAHLLITADEIRTGTSRPEARLALGLAQRSAA